MGHFPVRGASEPPLWQRLRRAMSTDSQKEARCREVGSWDSTSENGKLSNKNDWLVVWNMVVNDG